MKISIEMKEIIEKIAYKRMIDTLLYGESWVNYKYNENTGNIHVDFIDSKDIYKLKD